MEPAAGGRKRPRIAVALGGGGVRGLAHIGFLRVMQRAGVPIDALAGTSMGAIVAVGFALGGDRWSSQDLLDRLAAGQLVEAPMSAGPSNSPGLLSKLRKALVTERWLAANLRGVGPPFPEEVVELVDHLTRGRRLEEAPIPLAIVATDLIQGERVILREGPATWAALASSAIPAIFAPVPWGERLLVDGGFVDLVPVRVARELGAEIVVGVDVSGSDITPPRIRNGLEAFLRAVDISAEHYKQLQLREADLVVRVRFDEAVQTLDFSRARYCVQAGLRAGREALPAIEALIRRHLEAADQAVDRENGADAAGAGGAGGAGMAGVDPAGRKAV